MEFERVTFNIVGLFLCVWLIACSYLLFNVASEHNLMKQLLMKQTEAIEHLLAIEKEKTSTLLEKGG